MSNVVWLVRHAEMAHHRADVGLIGRGRAQAKATGKALAEHISPDDSVFISYSPVKRARETANLMYDSIRAAHAANDDQRPASLHVPSSDVALRNAGFMPGERTSPVEPSRLYDLTTDPDVLLSLPCDQADFYRGFWDSADPMGYWLAHDSGGGAETPAAVQRRVLDRLREIFCSNGGQPGSTFWALVTHSAPMRAVLQLALGSDPGEPDFSETVRIENAGAPERATVWHRGTVASLSLYDAHDSARADHGAREEPDGVL